MYYNHNSLLHFTLYAREIKSSSHALLDHWLWSFCLLECVFQFLALEDKSQQYYKLPKGEIIDVVHFSMEKMLYWSVDQYNNVPKSKGCQVTGKKEKLNITSILWHILIYLGLDFHRKSFSLTTFPFNSSSIMSRVWISKQQNKKFRS